MMDLHEVIITLVEQFGKEIIAKERVMPILGSKICFLDFHKYTKNNRSILKGEYTEPISNMLDGYEWYEKDYYIVLRQVKDSYCLVCYYFSDSNIARKVICRNG